MAPALVRPDGHVTAATRVVDSALARALAAVRADLLPGEDVATTSTGRIVLTLAHEGSGGHPERLVTLSDRLAELLADARGRGTVELGVGWAPLHEDDFAEALERADQAAVESLRRRDQQLVAVDHDAERGPVDPTRALLVRQVLIASVGTFVVPLAIMLALYAVGIDVSGVVYWMLVVVLGTTSAFIFAECLAALDPPRLPELPDPEERPAPAATAIIAAYLPSEAHVVMETLDAFLGQDYPGELQVILAYNTPEPMAIEDQLLRRSLRDPRLQLLKVHDSTSKAQNVNAALLLARGELTGIFDADHHPAQGSFTRAWRWIADGADIVQGHCVIRDAERSLLTRQIAVEFEQLYAVAHPGRAAVHGFGLFGGSNGYWRTDLLARTRMRRTFLTEDIESTIRTLTDGARIVNDPGLVSRELAPRDLKALWHQRVRWSQGWFQVTRRHLGNVLTSTAMTPRQKLGATYLMAWRDAYPWLATLSWPLLTFMALKDGGLDMLSSPFFTLLTLLITASGPVQVLTARRLAVPEIRQHRRWFLVACVTTLLLYGPFKNLAHRVSHLKELRGEHHWVVTARAHRPAQVQEVA